MENVNNALLDIVSYIKNTDDYKMCMSLKKQMDDNKELVDLINEVKKLQKKYVRSNYDSKIKEELDEVENKLNDIPIYNIYLNHLEKVNEMISYVKDSLNDYFYLLLNKK